MPEPDAEKTASGPADTAGSDGRTENAAERGQLYGFLAGVFRSEPGTEQLAEIAGPGFRQALSDAGVDFGEGWLDRPLEELRDELAVEYTRLFIGPGPHLSPHESVQRRGAEGRLWGKVTAEIARFIRDSGFRFEAAYHGLPDHIGVELEFMGALARHESAAWGRGDRDAAENCRAIARRFLTAHLGRWGPDFCRRVADRAEGPFYREMAALTARFIESEAQALSSRAEDAID